MYNKTFLKVFLFKDAYKDALELNPGVFNPLVCVRFLKWIQSETTGVN